LRTFRMATRPTCASDHLATCIASERKKRQRSEDCYAPELPDIPAISLKAMFGDDNDAKMALAQRWDHACRKVGFIKIKDHGVPRKVIDDCWKASEAFFEQPLAEKNSVPMDENYPYGYTGVGGENLLGSLDKDATNARPGDLKEMFNVCLGSANAMPDMPAPRWPKLSNSTVLEELQQSYKTYYYELASLAETLYRVCALALGLEESWFTDKNSSHRNVIRAIHYPAQKPPLVPKPGQVRASMHTDYGALTILRLGGQHPGGLQVMGANGAWIDVSTQPEEDCFVINLGDLMARWTNDRWLSTPHQVINPMDETAACARRLSIAYFCNINMDASVECVPTCAIQTPAKYEPIKAGDWLMRKHMQTVAGKLCYEKDQV